MKSLSKSSSSHKSSSKFIYNYNFIFKNNNISYIDGLPEKDDNIFIFGMNSEEVTNSYKNHDYNPQEIYNNDPEIRGLLEQLINGYFDKVDKDEFKEIFDNLVYKDRYFVLKDFHGYQLAHAEANEVYKDKHAWAEKAIVNIGKSGIFSSDRSIQEYADKIWNVKPLKK